MPFCLTFSLIVILLIVQ